MDEIGWFLPPKMNRLSVMVCKVKVNDPDSITIQILI